jgi:Acyl-CoA dehydrogenase, middle domain/Acyl-CoA dehydrogenase, N-terminal domain
MPENFPGQDRDLLKLAAGQDGWLDAALLGFRETVCGFCTGALAGQDHRAASDEDISGWSRDFAREFRHELGARGLLGRSWPRPHGDGLSILYDLVLADELEFHEAPAGTGLDSSLLHAPYLLIASGTRRLLADLMPRYRAGLIRIGLGYTEAEAGSDLAALTTTASRTRARGGCLINGDKVFTSGAEAATHLIIAAREDQFSDRDRHAAMTLFVVPADREGVAIHLDETLTGAVHARVSLRDVRAADWEVLGEPGGGWALLTRGIARERAIIGNPGLAELELGRLLSPGDAAMSCRPPVVVAALTRAIEARACSYLLTAAEEAGAGAPRDPSMMQVVKREAVRELQTVRLEHSQIAGADRAAPPTFHDSAEWHWLRDLYYLYAAGGLDVSRMVIARDLVDRP